jgi:hypothetical protein
MEHTEKPDFAQQYFTYAQHFEMQSRVYPSFVSASNVIYQKALHERGFEK